MKVGEENYKENNKMKGRVINNMGFLYNKSKSESFRPYFSQAKEIEKQYNQYHINQRQIDIVQGKYLFTQKNIGGLPLSWNKDKDVVSIDQTDSHSLIIGPTGSKKTRLIRTNTFRNCFKIQG